MQITHKSCYARILYRNDFVTTSKQISFDVDDDHPPRLTFPMI